jgi:hypothetical protein
MAGKLFLVAGMALAPAALADVEITGPDGRRILLNDNGTWQYADAKDKDRADGKSEGAGEAVLRLERKIDYGNNCRFALRLVNNLPYEIRSLVPYYSAYRANGVIYDTVSSNSGFALLKPGDGQARTLEFAGIACQDIVRVQVVGGDRCDMGELDKFSAMKGRCLARVRVVESDLVRFDK